MDMLMTLFIVGALAIFFKLYFNFEKIESLKIYSLYILMGIAILVKGGGGFAVPISIIFLFLLLEKNLKYFKLIKFGRGILIVLSIVIVWLAALYFQPQGKEYISLLLGQETLGRALKSKAHVRPFYYYLKMLPITTLPFTLFFLGAFFKRLKNLKNFKNWDNLEKISFCWTVAPLLFFSMMSGKLDIYLLPAYPGIVALIYCFIFNKENKKIVKLFFYITLGFILAGIFSLNFFLGKLNGILTISNSLVLTLFCSGALLFGLYTNFKNNLIKTSYSLIVTLLFIFGSSLFYLERYTDKMTLKPIINYIKTTPQKSSKVVVYRFSDGINMSTHISENIFKSDSINTLPEGQALIIVRNKYKKDLGEFKEVFSNNAYSIFLK
jgi:4-amino-4-deoxy-L-arabinose transferase-like glycosyltransferase